MIKFVLLSSLLLSSGSWAQEDEEILYKKVKREIVEDDVKERELKASLYIINERMKEMSSKISKVTDRFLRAQLRAKEVAKKTASLEEKVQLGQKDLSHKLRMMYKLKSQFFVKVLFSSANTYDLGKNLLFLKKLSHRDFELIEKLKKDMESLQGSRHRLRGQVRKLIGLKNTLRSQEKVLEEEQKNKMSLIAKVKKDRNMKVSQIKGLRGLLDKEKSALSISFFERKGRLTHPVKGWISNAYGVVQDPVYGYLLTHKGHFYEAPKGSLVYGVHPGIVAYSGMIDGYGRTVIVDHGDHYYTVYAGHEFVHVLEGEQVAEGTVLGSVGLSQRHQKIGAYFEIRHFSDAIDPAQWLVGNRNETL